MKVQVISGTVKTDKGYYGPGSVIDIEDTEGTRLLALGVASLPGAPMPADLAAKIEALGKEGK